MRFIKFKIKGLLQYDSPFTGDKRGFFLKAFDKLEYKKNKLASNIFQVNISSCSKKGTIRGLHYQANPNTEEKIFRCIKGSVFYVVVDMRKNSSTFLKWQGFTLD